MTKKPFISYIGANTFFAAYILCYFFINLFSLLKFPFVHSDELWLRGLSLAYQAGGSPLVTEPFFNTFPRQPHALKWAFHGLQAVWMHFFGTDISSLRALSLVFGVATLLLLYYLWRKSFRSSYALIGAMALSLHPQFLLTIRTGRQEVILLFGLVLMLYLVSYNGHYQWAGLICGILFFFHPNAALVGIMLFLPLLFKGLRHAIAFTLPFLSFGTLALGLSLWANSNFVTDYWQYGETHGVTAGISERAIGLWEYLYKLAFGISGSYYTVTTTSFFVLICFLFLWDLVHKEHRSSTYALGIIGFILGSFIIGRYNPTAIIFIYPFVFTWILERCSTFNLSGRQSSLILWVLCSAIILSPSLLDLTGTFQELNRREYLTVETLDYAYYDYINRISSTLEADPIHVKETIVLGNLSAAQGLDQFKFFDIRNLAYLEPTMLEDYLRSLQITHIIYYEAYDYILRNPKWSFMYGIEPEVLLALKDICIQKGTSLGAFESPIYGTRIHAYRGRHPWLVTIYRLND